jgi:hypothetical protein
MIKIFKKEKNEKICINYLSHLRDNFDDCWKITAHFLNKIKDENKSKIKLNILATQENNWFKYMPSNIEFEIKTFKNDKSNYISKIKYCTNEKSKYSVKLDEDCFFSNFIWDYIIENIQILDNENNLLLTPLLSNNIPLVDIFTENFISENEIKQDLYNKYISQEMPNGLWGVDYSILNGVTIDTNQWSPILFYDLVENLQTNKKGIHPIRISADSQIILNNYILNNISKLFEKRDYSLVVFEKPYFTTSTFIIKTQIWKDILKIKSEDAFDEIQLNIYRRKHNKNFMYIENGFGIHTVYNTIFGNKNMWNIGIEDGEGYEKDFVSTLINKLGI